jgi:hypothetical protein
MSSWSEIRLNSEDPLSAAINDLIVKANQSEAITNQIDVSKNISPLHVTNSKLEASDKNLTSFTARHILSQQQVTYFSPLEPDGKLLRVDAKFDHGGTYLTDYSCMGNQIEIGYQNSLPTLVKNTDDDGVTGAEIVSHLDGLEHYYRIPVTDQNSIKKMVQNGYAGFTVLYRCYTLTIQNELHSSNTQRATFFYFIENDQVEYACKAEVTDSGIVYFYVKIGSTTYWAKSQAVLVTSRAFNDWSTDFTPDNFDAPNPATAQTPVYPVPYQDFAFTFNFSTHVIQIYVNGVLKPLTVGAINPLPAPFPIGFADPTPIPVLTEPYITPFVSVYNQPVETTSLRINQRVTADLIPVYNVAGSPPTVDPLLLKYYVQPGTASPPTEAHSLGGIDSTDTSWVPLCKDTTDSNNCKISAFVILNSATGLGAAITGHVINQATFWVQGFNGPVGNMYCRIWDASGNVLRTLGQYNTANSNGVLVAVTFSDPGNTVHLAVGHRIGLEYTEGAIDDIVKVQRKNSDVDASVCQSVIHPGQTAWSNGTAYDMKCSLVEGVATAGTLPYIPLSNVTGDTQAQIEYFKTGSPIIGNVPTLIEYKVFRNASGTTAGTVYLRHYDSALNVKATLMSAPVSTLPTSDAGTYNFTWQDTSYPNPILNNESIGIEVSGVTSGYVYILTNFNNTVSNDYDGTNSIWAYLKGGTWFYNDTLDLAGRISKGGNSFTGYINLDDNRKRTGIKADFPASPLIGKMITRVNATFKRFGSPPAGLLWCRIRDSTGVIKTTLGSVDIGTISQSADTDVDFINTNSTYIMLLDDTISLEYDTGTATDLIQVRIATETFDSNNTVLFESYQAAINTTSPVIGNDLAAIVFTGGQTDFAARPMRGLKIQSGSPLIGKSITELRVKIKGTGSLSSGSYLNAYILQNQTHFIMAQFGSLDHFMIPQDNFVEFSFQNVDNQYICKVGDLIGFHFLFGDSENYIEIKCSDVSVDPNDIMFEWLGFGDTTYIDDTTHDLSINCFSGGFLITPDPANIPPLTPFHYVHAWYINAAIPLDSGAVQDPYTLMPTPFTYMESISKEFRVYSSILTIDQLSNYFNNRWTISPVAFGKVDVIGHSVLATNTPI